MKSQRQASAGVAAILALASACAVAAPVVPSAEDRQLAAPFQAWMARVFAVPDDPALDPSLREAMTTLARNHLARLATLLPAWIAEERARSATSVDREELNRQTGNRLINEIALWRLDSPGTDYDEVMLQAILKPGVCDRPYPESYLGRIMVWLQAVPAAHRATALAGERELLARWGRPRATLPPRPARSLAADEAAAIARLQAGDATPDVPMPPVLAAKALAIDPEPLDSSVRCALHQWGLARALRRGDAPAASLAAWRYQTILTAADWTKVPASAANAGSPPPGPEGYPAMARLNLVQGTVDVRVTPDAQGRFGSGTVSARSLNVPGLLDERPVAFETLLDDASIAQAALKFRPTPPAPDGRPASPVIVEIQWRLQ